MLGSAAACCTAGSRVGGEAALVLGGSAGAGWGVAGPGDDGFPSAGAPAPGGGRCRGRRSPAPEAGGISIGGITSGLAPRSGSRAGGAGALGPGGGAGADGTEEGISMGGSAPEIRVGPTDGIVSGGNSSGPAAGGGTGDLPPVSPGLPQPWWERHLCHWAAQVARRRPAASRRARGGHREWGSSPFGPEASRSTASRPGLSREADHDRAPSRLPAGPAPRTAGPRLARGRRRGRRPAPQRSRGLRRGRPGRPEPRPGASLQDWRRGEGRQRAPGPGPSGVAMVACSPVFPGTRRTLVGKPPLPPGRGRGSAGVLGRVAATVGSSISGVNWGSAPRSGSCGGTGEGPVEAAGGWVMLVTASGTWASGAGVGAATGSRAIRPAGSDAAATAEGAAAGAGSCE